jgi:predicted XRE-type DNA-binding protein
MNDEPFEIVRGSGNVFRDFGYPDADIRQTKALLGAQVMLVLDEEGLSTREAQARTGVSHSDFSRIRQAKFSRFTIDRLMGILGLLGQDVEMSVTVHPRVRTEAVELHP